MFMKSCPILVLSVLLIFFISGCTGQEKTNKISNIINKSETNEQYINSQEKENKTIIQPDTANETQESDLLPGQLYECKPVGNHQYYRTDRTFIIDPNDPNTMYVSVEHKGFFKTVDGGKTWILKTKGIKTYGKKNAPAESCHGEYPVAIIDPRNPKHIILALSGTPSTFDFGYTKAGGLVESWDGAENWGQMIQGWMSIYVTDVAVDPSDSKTIYYSTAAQAASNTEADPNRIFVTKGLIYKTMDDGQTWEELETGFILDSAVTAIYLNPKNPQEIFATTYTAPRPEPGQGRNTGYVEQMGFLKSLDGGKTWKAIHSLPKGFEAVVSSAVSLRDYNRIFVSPSSPHGQRPKSFYSKDGGMTFNESDIFIDMARFDPHDETGNRLLGYQRTTTGPAPPAIYESNDAGATWKKLSDAPNEIINNLDVLSEASSIVWDPTDKNVVYLTGAAGHIWKSSDNGKTWEVILNIDKLENEQKTVSQSTPSNQPHPPDPPSVPATSNSQPATSSQQPEQVIWYHDTEWRPSSKPPTCPEPLVLQTPVNINLATSILYPGQTRGGHYKAHGGFRFDNSQNNDITVKAPLDGFLVRGSRYKEDGEVQYMFDIINPCGIMIRFDHLLVLSPKFAEVAERLPQPKEGDSRTTTINFIPIKAGDVVATAVGIKETSNVGVDFGVYDLRQKNKASKNQEWLSQHGGEQAPYALCWLGLLPPADIVKAKNLPGADSISGKESDYCE